MVSRRELWLVVTFADGIDLQARVGSIAQAQLDLARQPYTSADLAKAESAVTIAQQQLKLAQDPFTSADLAAARSYRQLGD